MAKPEVLMVSRYPDWEMPALERDYVVHKLWLAEDRGRFLSEVGPLVRAVATNGVLGAGAELIDACPKLEIIACFGVGFDAIDLDRARARGVRVTNTQDVLTEDVADMAFALILASMRRIVEGEAFVRSGAWVKGALPLGQKPQRQDARSHRLWPDRPRHRPPRAGLRHARRLLRPRRRSGGAARLFSRSRLARTGKRHPCRRDRRRRGTRNLVNAAVFDALGPEGLFVNVSRGTVVDEGALIAALEEKRIGAAALDVFWNEPNIDPRLLGFKNVIVQPHHASGTVEARKAMGKLVRDNLAAHFAGRPLPTPVV